MNKLIQGLEHIHTGWTGRTLGEIRLPSPTSKTILHNIIYTQVGEISEQSAGTIHNYMSLVTGDEEKWLLRGIINFLMTVRVLLSRKSIAGNNSYQPPPP